MTERVLYTMPDGNDYEFENDEVATRAYKAWADQFGDTKKSEQPKVEVKKEQPKQEVPIEAKIAANPLMRLALGASAPFRGAFEMIPGSIGDEWIARNKDLDRIVEEGKRAYPDYVNDIGSVSDFAGNALSPMFLGLTKVMPTAKTLLPKGGKSPLELIKNIATPNNLVTQGTILGGVSGATAPTGATGGERVGQTLVGAGLGGVLSPAVGKVIQGVGNVIGPMFSEKVAERGAARMASKVAGDRAAQIAQRLQNSNADETAAQAAADVASAEFSALEPLVAGRKASEFAQVAPNREAARRAALSAITPDEAAADAARKAASDPHYAAAMRRSIKIDPTLEVLFDRMPSGVMEAAANIAKVEGKPFDYTPGGRISGESLHYIKRALSDISNAADPSKGIGRDAQRSIRDLLDDYLITLDYKNPSYGKARQIYSQMSEPVNQAKVLKEMSSVMDNYTGGERVTPFLNVLGRGEKALLKRSTGFPRYGDLSDVLDPVQMDTINHIAAEMRRDANLNRLAKEGMAPALEKLRAGELKDVRAPSLMDAKFTLLNRLLNILEGTGGAKTESALARMMLPRSAGGDTAKLGGLMELYQRNPQEFAQTFIKRVAPPVIHKASEPTQAFDE